MSLALADVDLLHLSHPCHAERPDEGRNPRWHEPLARVAQLFDCFGIQMVVMAASLAKDTDLEPLSSLVGDQDKVNLLELV